MAFGLGGEMRGSSVRRGRRRIALVAALAAVFGVFLSVGAGSAAAASTAATCSYNNGFVEIALLGDTAVLNKGNLSHINVNNVWCGGAATTSNTHTIIVYGNGANDRLVVDLSGGDLEPGNAGNDWDLIQTGSGLVGWIPPREQGGGGFPDGREGKSDLEILLDGVEYLSVIGNASADKLTVGDGDPIILDCPSINRAQAPVGTAGRTSRDASESGGRSTGARRACPAGASSGDCGDREFER